MLKEYVIRTDDLKHDKMLVRKCKALCKQYEGEYYTRVIDDKYQLGHQKLTPKVPAGSKLFWERTDR